MSQSSTTVTIFDKSKVVDAVMSRLQVQFQVVIRERTAGYDVAVILYVTCFGVCNLICRSKEHGLKMLENRGFRKIFGNVRK